ncbi:hypothetical protein, partial [Nocardia wallacei]|uniref:hypothetical protein n=1 Tax=Nocardia wallacei TaxID=480035 RepID=UPI003CC7C937
MTSAEIDAPAHPVRIRRAAAGVLGAAVLAAARGGGHRGAARTGTPPPPPPRGVIYTAAQFLGWPLALGVGRGWADGKV